MRKKLLTSLLAVTMAFSLSVIPAAALELKDAKHLLESYYVDKIPEDVLSQDSLDKLLDALGDPYTVYMTSEEYQKFLSAVNGDMIVGIGVSIETAFDNGYSIMSILPNSPALEAGLEAGDRITAVNGITLTARTDVRALIAGEEGTSVTITVLRQADSQRKSYTMTRRSVIIPIVTYSTVGNAGVIDCISFGSSTIDTIQKALESLNKEVSVWIMDLRSNPGGVSEAAAGSAGLFVGSDTMVYFRDAAGEYNYLYTLPSCPDLTDKPLIVLTSPYSASASELFTAAARDHGFGIAIGQRTFGKGIAQLVLDESTTPNLFHGDALKVTAYRFFSPDGATNHTVGVIPTLMLSPENTAAAALLLSNGRPNYTNGYLKLEIAGQTLYLNQDKAMLNAQNQAAFTELLEALPPSAVLSRGTVSESWVQVSPAQLAAELELNYTARTFLDIAGTPFEQGITTLAAYQLLDGYPDHTFRPQSTITRAEFCAMVASAFGLSAHSKALPFSDVDADAWYADALSAMASKGFIAGCGNGSFCPDSTITYQEMVTVLSAVAAWSSMDGAALAQEPVPVEERPSYDKFSAWAQTSARTLDHLGALVGELAPLDNGTREVAAGMLYSLMNGIHLLWD